MENQPLERMLSAIIHKADLDLRFRKTLDGSLLLQLHAVLFDPKDKSRRVLGLETYISGIEVIFARDTGARIGDAVYKLGEAIQENSKS